MHKMSGMEAMEGPYLRAPLFRLARKRATWLVALFLGEMMTATAMGHQRGEGYDDGYPAETRMRVI